MSVRTVISEYDTYTSVSYYPSFNDDEGDIIAIYIIIRRRSGQALQLSYRYVHNGNMELVNVPRTDENSREFLAQLDDLLEQIGVDNWYE